MEKYCPRSYFLEEWFLEAVHLYWFIYLSIFIAKALFDHFWICVSLHCRVLIFDKLIIYLPLWLFSFMSAHCHRMNMEFLPVLWFGPPPVIVPHFWQFFCLISLFWYIYISLPYSESQLEHKSCELSAWSYLFIYPVILWSPATLVCKDMPYGTYLYSQHCMFTLKCLLHEEFHFYLHLLQIFFKGIEVPKNNGNMHIEV